MPEFIISNCIAKQHSWASHGAGHDLAEDVGEHKYIPDQAGTQPDVNQYAIRLPIQAETPRSIVPADRSNI